MAINLDSTGLGTFSLKPPASAGNYTLTLPSFASISGAALSTGPTGGLNFNTLGTGAFSTGIANTGTNATNYVTAIYAVSGTVNQDFAIARRTGNAPFLMVQVPDGTTTGGNARGTNSIDFQTTRTAASQVAAGNYSGLIGTSTSSVGSSRSVVLAGSGMIVNGSSGNDPSLWVGCRSMSGDSSTSGFKAYIACFSPTTDSFQTNHGAYNIVGPGQTLSGTSAYCHLMGNEGPTGGAANGLIGKRQVLWARSTTNTAVPMTTNGAAAGSVPGTSNIVVFYSSDYDSMYVRLRIIATVEQAGSSTIGDTAAWLLEFYSYRLVGVASVVTTAVTNTQLYGDAGTTGWSVAVSANTTLGNNGGPLITCTGQLTTTIRWLGYIEVVEMNAVNI